MKKTQDLKDYIRRDDVQSVKERLDEGRDPNEPIEDLTPLFIAAMYGSKKVATLLVERGADVDRVCEDDETAIFPAARGGYEAIVRLLVTHGATVNRKNRVGSGASPIDMCVIAADSPKFLPVVKLLLDAGADPNLHAAAGNSKISGLIPLLVAHGGDPNGICPRRNAGPLHVAVDRNNLSAARELLEAGADPHLRALISKGGWSELTPLEYAKKENFRKMVELLEGKPPSATEKKASLSMADAWQRLARILAQADGQLRKGAVPAEIAACEKACRIKLSKEVAAFFQTHNGQLGGPPAIPSETEGRAGFRLLSLEEAMSESKIMNDLLEGGDFEDLEPSADPGVKPRWWNPKWLPFAANGLGDLYCFDFDPAKGGKKGQVICFLHESARRAVISSSPTRFLASLVEGT